MAKPHSLKDLSLLIGEPFESSLVGGTSGQGSPQSTCTAQNEDPLILDVQSDLASTSVELSSQADGVDFDIQNKGTKTRISWPLHPEKAMFLTLPENGKVTSGAQLFGTETLYGPNHLKSKNGFKALKRYATHNKNVLDTRDPIFPELRLWSDMNRDGIATPEELIPLSAKGIVSINLKYRNMFEIDIYGNSTRQRSWFTTSDSVRHMIFDVWFELIH